MEKKSNPNVQGQLDFNAPLMSVRRIAGSPIESEKVDSKIDCRSDSSSKPSPPVYRSELKSGPVRNPGTVPFMWEQSPGKPKDEDRVKANHNYPGPRTPRLPPGRTLTVKQANTEKTEISSNGDANHAMINTEQRNRNSGNMLQQDSSAYQQKASAKISARIDDKMSSGSNGKLVKPVSSRAYPDKPFNQSGRPGDDLDPEVYDDFSDALETLSLTESCTVGCSVSLVSGMEDQDSTSSSRRVDPQTRNFMIDRFLPAAKAIASESPQQTSRRLPSKDPPRSLSAGRGSRGPSPFHSRTLMAKREIKHKERDNIAALSSKACGLFPWRFKNAFSHLSPLSYSARMKSKKHFSLSPAPNRGNSRGNLSDGEPFSESDDEERTWEAIYRQKLVYGNQYSGYDDRRGFSLNASPEIKDGVMNRISCGSDSQSSNKFRTPTSGGISPYRNEPFRSPFSEGAGFLGFPKTDKEDTIPYMETRRSCNSLNDMGTEDLCFWKSPPLLGNSTRSGSVSPVVEKTVYVDSVHKTIPSEVKPSFSKHDELMKGSGSKFDVSIPDTQRKPENYVSKTSCVDSMEIPNIGKERNVLKSKNLGQSSSLVVMESYCSDQPVCVSKDSGCREQSIISVGSKNIDDIPVKEGWPLGISSKCKEVAAEKKPLFPVNLKPENNGSDMESPLAPPLPKSPSESWLWRAMPRPSSPVSPSSQYSRFGSPLRKQQQGSKSSITDPKWENIVKSTHKQLSHLRFSEEFNRQASPSSLRDSGS